MVFCYWTLFLRIQLIFNTFILMIRTTKYNFRWWRYSQTCLIEFEFYQCLFLWYITSLIVYQQGCDQWPRHNTRNKYWCQHYHNKIDLKFRWFFKTFIKQSEKNQIWYFVRSNSRSCFKGFWLSNQVHYTFLINMDKYLKLKNIEAENTHLQFNVLNFLWLLNLPAFMLDL